MKSIGYTAGALIERIAARHPKDKGWAFFPEMRDGAGFSAQRTIDALAFGMWPSLGFEMVAYEVKVSRADWLRELEKPEKGRQWVNLADSFWLVVAGEDIVRDGELPPRWGLAMPRGRGLTTIRAAVPRYDGPAEPIDRNLVAAMLTRGLESSMRAKHDMRRALIDEAKKQWEAERKHLEELLEQERKRVAMFEGAIGVKLNSWSYPDGKVAAALKLLVNGAGDLKNRAADLRRQAQRIAGAAGELELAANEIEQLDQIAAVGAVE